MRPTPTPAVVESFFFFTGRRRFFSPTLMLCSCTTRRLFYHSAYPEQQQQQQQQQQHPPVAGDFGDGGGGASASAGAATVPLDARLVDLNPMIQDEYATLRDHYRTPKHPIVLAHGLLGFDELPLAGRPLAGIVPGVQYWRGIKEAMAMNGIEVITASVPPSASVEERAEKLLTFVEGKVREMGMGVGVNIIAGLDSRYMISRLKPTTFHVRSLTTIASPHRGSSFADYVFSQIGRESLPRIYRAMDRLNLDYGAFRQLTREYMEETFNPETPDVESVRYFSYGAVMEPSLFSVFRQSHRIIEEAEGPNDGMVSVASCKWGAYKGTLMDVSHLDLINWTNRLKWFMAGLTGHQRNFNAIAFYLDMADMLEKEGL